MNKKPNDFGLYEWEKMLSQLIKMETNGTNILDGIQKLSKWGFKFLERQPKQKGVCLIIDDLDAFTVAQFKYLLLKPLGLTCKFTAFADKGVYVPLLKIFTR